MLIKMVSVGSQCTHFTVISFDSLRAFKCLKFQFLLCRALRMLHLQLA